MFATDNHACFIERERILNRLKAEMVDYSAEDKYALIFAKLLSEVSVPISEWDYFEGRVVEALADEDLEAPNSLFGAIGHISPDYKKILNRGLKGIVEDISKAAEAKGDADSKSFAHNARIVAAAVRDYCLRYAQEIEKWDFLKWQLR